MDDDENHQGQGSLPSDDEKEMPLEARVFIELQRRLRSPQGQRKMAEVHARLALERAVVAGGALGIALSGGGLGPALASLPAAELDRYERDVTRALESCVRAQEAVRAARRGGPRLAPRGI